MDSLFGIAKLDIEFKLCEECWILVPNQRINKHSTFSFEKFAGACILLEVFNRHPFFWTPCFHMLQVTLKDDVFKITFDLPPTVPSRFL